MTSTNAQHCFAAIGTKEYVFNSLSLNYTNKLFQEKVRFGKSPAKSISSREIGIVKISVRKIGRDEVVISGLF